LPELAGTSIGDATVLQLGTYTAGGLPLQVPEEVTDETVTAYLRSWTPEYPLGEMRVYSNCSIGLFGQAAAHAAGARFATAMEHEVLHTLGLTHSMLQVPPESQSLYAWGVDAENRPRRVRPGVFDDEAYGIKASIADVARYVRAQLDPRINPSISDAIELTHRGWYSVGPMTQGLGWEMYAYPVSLADLLKGNARDVVFEPNRVTEAKSLGDEVLYNKTGSTAGFGAYVAFVPARRIGVAVLANRSVPIPARISLAYGILSTLDPRLTPTRGATPAEDPK
jgi:CubicO group peptidase (beta-lactamase class C family)